MSSLDAAALAHLLGEHSRLRFAPGADVGDRPYVRVTCGAGLVASFIFAREDGRLDVDLGVDPVVCERSDIADLLGALVAVRETSGLEAVVVHTPDVLLRHEAHERGFVSGLRGP